MNLIGVQVSISMLENFPYQSTLFRTAPVKYSVYIVSHSHQSKLVFSLILITAPGNCSDSNYIQLFTSYGFLDDVFSNHLYPGPYQVG